MTDTEIQDGPDGQKPRFRIGRADDGRTSIIDLVTGFNLAEFVTEASVKATRQGVEVVLRMADGSVELAPHDAD